MPRRTVLVTASYLKRFAAALCDLAIISLVLAVPMRKLLQEAIPSGSLLEAVRFALSGTVPDGVMLIVMVTNVIVGSAYFFLFERHFGQSLGKMLLKLRIVPVGRDRPSYLLRSMLFMLALNSIVLLALDLGYALFNERGQRLGEQLSRTMVVEEG